MKHQVGLLLVLLLCGNPAFAGRYTGQAAAAAKQNWSGKTGRTLPIAYPATSVNVNLPDPKDVGRERRATSAQRQSQWREAQNTSQLAAGKRQADRRGALAGSNANTYHGISEPNSTSTNNGFRSRAQRLR